MSEYRKYVINQSLLVLLGETVAVALMIGVYALIGKFSVQAVLGGLVGVLLASGNFFFMAMIATLAADKAEQQDVEGGKKLIKSSYPIRILVLAAVLFLCGKSGWCDVIAMAVPLLLVRPILTIQEFFKKKGA